MADAYAICRYVSHYTGKNGYLPRRVELGCSEEDVDLMVKNGILELIANYEGGPKIYVRLTDKGLRMSSERRRR